MLLKQSCSSGERQCRMPSHARVNRRNRGHQRGLGVTVQSSVRTKSLHGIVQGLCVLAGIKAWEILHRPPVDLGERRRKGKRGRSSPCWDRGKERLKLSRIGVRSAPTRATQRQSSASNINACSSP